jgi:hypothetical protein
MEKLKQPKTSKYRNRMEKFKNQNTTNTPTRKK